MTDLPKTAILVSHGQPSAPELPERRLAELARDVAGLLPDWHVTTATLATPGPLQEVMQPQAVIYPFFMARGWFTTKVLPQRLAAWRYDMACPYGLDPDLPDLVAAALSEDSAPIGAPAPLLLAAHGSAPAGALMRARVAAYWVLHHRFALSTPQVGRLLGGRHYSSVINGLERAERLRARDAWFAGD